LDNAPLFNSTCQEHTNSHPRKLHFGPLKIFLRTPGFAELPVGNRCSIVPYFREKIHKSPSRFYGISVVLFKNNFKLVSVHRIVEQISKTNDNVNWENQEKLLCVLYFLKTRLIRCKSCLWQNL